MRGRAAAWGSKINSLQNGCVIRKQSPDMARTNSTYQRYKRDVACTSNDYDNDNYITATTNKINTPSHALGIQTTQTDTI